MRNPTNAWLIEQMLGFAGAQPNLRIADYRWQTQAQLLKDKRAS